MNNFAAVHIKKIKSLAHLNRARSHNGREPHAVQPNHDPEKIKDNIAHIESEDPSAKWREIVGDNNGRKMRSDAVRAVEITCIFSPDAKERIDPKEWGEKCVEWAAKKYGRENIISAHTHVDETTPHTQILMVPMSQKTGRISARELFGMPALLKALQTDFANEVGQCFGLVRGNAGSKARHIGNQEYFERVREQLKVLKGEFPQAILPKKPLESAKAHAEKANSVLAATIDNAARALATLQNEQVTHDRLRVQSLKDREALKVEQDKLRELDLISVMRVCGYEVKKIEGDNWVFSTEKGHVIINKEKQIFNLDWGKVGGRGAIDLAMEVRSLTFKDAVGWLASYNPDIAAASATQHLLAKTKRIKPKTDAEMLAVQTASDPSKVEAGKAYLVDRGISPKLADALFEKKKVWTNRMGSLVFPHKLHDKPEAPMVGASVRGVGNDFKGYFGSRDGYWQVTSAMTPEDKSPKGKMHLFESALDALSAFTRGLRGSLNSLGGTTVPESIKGSLKRLICCFDGDEAGEKGAVRLQAEVGDRFERVSPGLGMDWNDLLLKEKKSREKVEKVEKVEVKKERKGEIKKEI